MLARLAADAVLLAHLAFIAFAVAGSLLALRRRWMVLLHLPVLAWAVLVEAMGWTCPLTPLENRLRAAGGAAGYRGGFVEHYLVPLIYPEALTRELQYWLGGGLLVLNLLLYAWLWRVHRRGTTKRPPAAGGRG